MITLKFVTEIEKDLMCTESGRESDFINTDSQTLEWKIDIDYNTTGIVSQKISVTGFHYEFYDLENNFIVKKITEEFIDKWDIEILDKSQANTTFFKGLKTTSGGKLNTKIPSGVTGHFHMYLFLHDVNDLRYRMENSDRVQHELCHALLYDKLGTREKIFVEEVHNAEEINDKFKITFWYYSKWAFWARMPISIANIRKWFING